MYTPFRLSTHSYEFFDNCKSFAHRFVSEVFKADRLTMQTGVCWESNAIISEKAIVRD